MAGLALKFKNLWRRLITGSLTDVSSIAHLSVLPDNLKITRLAETGVYVIDNFCSAEEAADIIKIASSRLGRSGIRTAEGFTQSNERSSYTALMYGPKFRCQTVVPLMQRAAALVGLPYTHLEEVYVTRYRETEFYGQHIDFGDHFDVDRLYTVLLYLNTLPEEHGGATVFPSLKAAVQPLLGRAVTWTNKNPDGSGHLETNHAAFPIKNDGEKWVIQFWFRRYRLIDPDREQTRHHGVLTDSSGANNVLPEGVRHI
ncbi:MAG: prolyl hydroxylase family protein [Gammaproteobacteria bacterium]